MSAEGTLSKKSPPTRCSRSATADPSMLYPGVPTIAASGLAGYDVATIYGMWAPAKTSDAIVLRLNQEIVRVLGRPDVKERFLNSGIETVGSTPAEFAAMVKSQMAKMGKVIKEAGIRSD